MVGRSDQESCADSASHYTFVQPQARGHGRHHGGHDRRHRGNWGGQRGRGQGQEIARRRPTSTRTTPTGRSRWICQWSSRIRSGPVAIQATSACTWTTSARSRKHHGAFGQGQANPFIPAKLKTPKPDLLYELLPQSVQCSAATPGSHINTPQLEPLLRRLARRTNTWTVIMPAWLANVFAEEWPCPVLWLNAYDVA